VRHARACATPLLSLTRARTHSYPNDALTLTLAAVAAPSLNVTEAGAAGALQFSLAMSALSGGRWSYALTLALSFDFGLDLSVASSPNGTVLTGEVTQLQLAVSVAQSAIGPVSAAPLQRLASLLLPVAEKLINAELAQGVLVMPTGPGFALVDPKLVYRAGYLAIASDFTYTPPADLLDDA
jgi:hypothetical protein